MTTNKNPGKGLRNLAQDNSKTKRHSQNNRSAALLQAWRRYVTHLVNNPSWANLGLLVVIFLHEVSR